MKKYFIRCAECSTYDTSLDLNYLHRVMKTHQKEKRHNGFNIKEVDD